MTKTWVVSGDVGDTAWAAHIIDDSELIYGNNVYSWQSEIFDASTRAGLTIPIALYVVFGSVVNVDEMETDYQQAFFIDYSNDGIIWTTLPLNMVTCDAHILARYVRARAEFVVSGSLSAPILDKIVWSISHNPSAGWNRNADTIPNWTRGN